MRILIGGIAVVIVLTIIVALGMLTWLNRASEKSLVNVASVGIIGVASALVSLVFSLQASSIKEECTTTAIFHKQTKRPLYKAGATFLNAYSEGSLPWLERAVDAALEAHPELATEPSIEAGQKLYLDVKLRTVIDTLCFIFGPSWDVQVRASILPGFSSRSSEERKKRSGTAVTLAQMAAMAPEIGALSPSSPPEHVTLPPHSTFGISHPEGKREIAIENAFVSVVISLREEGGVLSIGELQRIGGISAEEAQRYWHQAYLVTMSADFKRFRAGHPEMPLYHRWVEVMFKSLRDELDSERRWNQIREDLLFQDAVSRSASKAIPSTSPGSTQP